MSFIAPTSPNLRFGLFELDVVAGELRKAGILIKLQPQPFRVLLQLVNRAGTVVTREDIKQDLWSDSTFVDFDHGINFAINQIRAALADSADNPRYIETLPRRGYRFIAQVEHELSVAEDSIVRAPGVGDDSGNAGAGDIDLPASSGSWWRNVRFSIVAAVVVVLLILAVQFARRRFTRPANPSGERVMLAVLPFANFSGDASQEYFNDGLTEEMITLLGSADPKRLGVIARTSAMKYKNTQKDVQQIGRELGVDYVLEGSVRREGDRVRISAQLIQVRDQTHLWAESYERDGRDTLALEILIANTISDEVELTLSPPRAIARRTNARPVNPAAYDLYLQGRFYWNQRTEAGFRKGVESFNQAIAKDPNFAQAYVGLADCYILLGPNDVMPAKQVYPLAKEAVLKALQLDDTLAEAHASLGFVTLLYDWNPTRAENEFRRAIELDPNYPTAHHWYAYDLAAMNRSDEAIAEIRRAVELDPVSAIVNTDACQILFLARRDDEAIAQCQKTIGLDPQFGQAYWYLGLLYEQKGMFDQAFEAFMKATPGPADSAQGVEFRAAYRHSGINGYWHQRLAMLERQSEAHYVSPWTFAVSHALAGERGRALEDLEKAFDERYPSMVFVQVEPVFDSLRSNQRFKDLLHRISSPP
jgi:TolB-like protein/DNA-binding winged helix-turn-helix (wHTH) protein/Flp pilus assembly protein TadD